ncbi:MAG: glucokinase [Pseudomonadota bacterium]
MELLAGDIGGTNTRLAIYQTNDGVNFQALAEEIFPSREFQTLEQILKLFLDNNQAAIKRACFGIAGPIIDQTCDATNLPWQISAALISKEFGFDHCSLLNDLEANAWGIGALGEHDFHTLNPGQPGRIGNASIISAGTGLGEAGLYWDGQIHRPFPSEGGHTDFSPSNKLEYELNEFLAARHGHVSWERLVSGPGLENIHAFLRHHHASLEPDWLQQKIRQSGAAPVISETALAKRDPICEEALDIFVTLYAREAANHALKILASAGVYLGGGIAPKILPRLEEADFLQAFFNKGRMRHLVEAMPVKVILNDKAALLGAARFAALH